jgi:hypothetical protein
MAVLLSYDMAQSPGGTGQVTAAGGVAQAGWRLLNSGGCTWDAAYGLVDGATGMTAPLPRVVPPGEWVDVWVNFRAPQQVGAASLPWELHNGSGQRVGPPLTLIVTVAAIPTPSMPPGVSLRAYPDEIYPGEQTIISWQVSQAKAVYFYPAGQNWRVHPVQASGNFADHPDRSTTYELRVVHGDDSVETQRVRVEVLPYEPPAIRYFRVKWEQHIENQWCVRLEWEVTGRAMMVNIFRDGAPMWIDALESGVTRNCVAGPGIYVYRIQAIGPGGEVNKECTVKVGK